MKAAAICAVTAFLAPYPANADTALNLLRECERRSISCAIAVASAVQMHNALASRSGAPSICMPAGVNVEQAARVFMEHAGRNPAMLNRPFGEVFLAAMAGAFPCRR